MALVYRHKPITRTDRNYLLVDSPQFTVISCQFTGLPVNQFTSSQLSVASQPVYHRLTTDNGERRTHHSRLTSHHSLLIATLGLIKFSIQWLWSVATTHHSNWHLNVASIQFFKKKSLSHRFTTHHRLTTDNWKLRTHHSPLTITLLHHYTNPPLTTHHSLLTTNNFKPLMLHHFPIKVLDFFTALQRELLS